MSWSSKKCIKNDFEKGPKNSYVFVKITYGKIIFDSQNFFIVDYTYVVRIIFDFEIGVFGCGRKSLLSFTRRRESRQVTDIKSHN